MDTADSIFEGLCLPFGSVLPYSEIYSLNLLLESQGEKRKTERVPKFLDATQRGSPRRTSRLLLALVSLVSLGMLLH